MYKQQIPFIFLQSNIPCVGPGLASTFGIFGSNLFNPSGEKM